MQVREEQHRLTTDVSCNWNCVCVSLGGVGVGCMLHAAAMACVCPLTRVAILHSAHRLARLIHNHKRLQVLIRHLSILGALGGTEQRGSTM